MRGKWSDILVHANWTSERDGFFHVYVNGETNTAVFLEWTDEERPDREVYFKFGIYRTYVSLRFPATSRRRSSISTR